MSCIPKEASVEETTAIIAEQLGERDERALRDIEHIVAACGRSLTLRLLAEAQQIEAEGGMLTRDRSRRRTLGGVFFEHANRKLKRFDSDLWWQAIGRHRWDDMPAAPEAPPAATPATEPLPIRTVTRPALSSDEKQRSWHQVRAQLQLELSGRPTNIIEQPNYAMLLFTLPFKAPLLQAGVPALTSQPSHITYRVYLGRKQWLKIKDALASPDTSLHIQIFRGNGSVVVDAQRGEYQVFPGNRVHLRYHNRQGSTGEPEQPAEGS